jgi:hypothetical protein
MKAELLKVGRKENCEITVRDAGGLFGFYLVGPGSISVTVSKKKKRKKKKFERRHGRVAGK